MRQTRRVLLKDNLALDEALQDGIIKIHVENCTI